MNKKINYGSNPSGKRLEKRFWRNWIFLSTVLFIAIAGLTTAIPPLLSGRVSSPWPWVKTDLVLIVGLSVVVLAFIGYLTQQQRKVNKMRRAVHELIEYQGERFKRDNARLRALLSVSQKMSMETDNKCVFNAITDACVETFGCQRASLMLLDNETQELVVDSVSGEVEKSILNTRVKMGESIAGWVAEKRKSVLISDSGDLKKYPELDFKNPSVISAMIVPIILRDEVIGVMNISAESENIRYSEEDLNTLQVFSENVGASIRHKEQTDWLKSMVQTLSKRLSESYDKEFEEEFKPQG
ncbi:MAG TPA: GAF domain-containing protein [Candidatus Krumholzibacteriaceae bacterium]|nr:GAF domain-containing protein [Candidatus Krumholzibacteriaceae bacterium]